MTSNMLGEGRLPWGWGPFPPPVLLVARHLGLSALETSHTWPTALVLLRLSNCLNVVSHIAVFWCVSFRHLSILLSVVLIAEIWTGGLLFLVRDYHSSLFWDFPLVLLYLFSVFPVFLNLDLLVCFGGVHPSITFWEKEYRRFWGLTYLNKF